MASLQIHDLQINKLLDEKALATVYGGLSFGWIVPYQPNRSSSPASVLIGQMQVFNLLLVNPVFNQIEQTVNQVNFVDITTTEVVDSSVNVLVGQGNSGSNSSLPLPI